MNTCEPLVRRRGFFFHSDTSGEPDTGEHENPEGFVVRVRVAHPHISQHTRVISSSRHTRGRSHSDTAAALDDTRPAIRSGSVTGSRQRAH